jgi:protease IV
MIKFLRWAGRIAAGTLNGFVKLFLGLVLIFVVFGLFGLLRGDGLPRTMVLSLDLRDAPADSASNEFTFGVRPATVMDIVLGLDAAARDSRVKGVFVRLGSADLSIAAAQEIAAALKRFRAAGKFVVAHAQGFNGGGLGDYLAATAAGEIWMQPKSSFYPAGEGGGRIYLRGLFDKAGVTAQIAKRAEYKSAADMYTATGMSEADREQTAALLRSWYDTAVGDAAAARKLAPAKLAAAFEASPQFSEDAKKAKLIDKIGYDDDARKAALDRAGDGDEVAIERYVEAKRQTASLRSGTKIALIEAAGTISEGDSHNDPIDNSPTIGGDDIAAAIRDAAKDDDIRAIVLRIDSPGGSVVASDQILAAVKKARAAGKPVVVSMGAVAASGGYYVALGADRIVAQPGTLTGSIGVFTGKLSFGGTLEKIGVKTEQIAIGKNALINSQFTPYTADQWAAINAEADAIYADFTGKVAAGRKLPIEKVREIARGRVWTGKDAAGLKLVDTLGGFWTAVDAARKLAKIGAGERVVFVEYPRKKGMIETLRDLFGGASVLVATLERVSALLDTPLARATVAASASPHGGIELRATNLPR